MLLGLRFLSLVGEILLIVAVCAGISRTANHAMWKHYYRTRSRATAILEFPATYLHELLHFACCMFLNVKALEFDAYLYPRSGLLGYVKHEDSGPVKNFLIGLAPIGAVPALIALLARLGHYQPWTRVFSSGWLYISPVLFFTLVLALCPSTQDMDTFLSLFRVTRRRWQLALMITIVVFVPIYVCLAAGIILKKYDLNKLARSLISGMTVIRNYLLPALLVVVCTGMFIVATVSLVDHIQIGRQHG
jgi:uncharacterized membrane protein